MSDFERWPNPGDGGDSEISEARAVYQDVRRALFSVQVLNEVQASRASVPEVDRVIADLERRAGFTSSVPLINQAAFLQMAYMTFVYPRENILGQILNPPSGSKPKGGGRGWVPADGSWAPDLAWDETVTVHGEGRVKAGDWVALLWTIRNALVHSDVVVEDNRFIFTDQDKGRLLARVSLSWEALGALCMSFFKRGDAVLYGVPGRDSN